MDPIPSLFFKEPPPLDPAWLAHEKASNLLSPKSMATNPLERQRTYSQACKTLNASLLSGRDAYLNHGIETHDSFIKAPDEDHLIPIRHYTSSKNAEITGVENIVIYYHGGGLTVGDLDSEDLSCRRIVKSIPCTLYSVDYRLMPQHTSNAALADAISAFQHIAQNHQSGKLVLMGSSSGGQLAAQVSQLPEARRRVCGVLLRCPVTVDATNLPARYKGLHVSMNEAFHTSLLSSPALTRKNRTEAKLPLEEEELGGMPRHWVQVCSNDVYYSDGVRYAEALREEGGEVRVDVVRGWPHTFWLKAPVLERAVEAERDTLDGMRWLLEG